MSRVRAFLLSFLLSAGIIIPLLGCVVLMQGKRMKAKQQEEVEAGNAVQGVPIALATPDDHIACLAVIETDTEPIFLLVGLDAVENRVSVLGFPAQTVVLSPQGSSTLKDECVQAGPGRATQLLGETLQLEIPYYLSVDAATLASAAADWQAVTVNLSGYDIDGVNAQVGKAPVCMLVAEQATSLLDEWKLENAARSDMLANMMGEFLLSAILNQPTAVADALRDCSSKMLTTLTSQEFLKIDRICGLMNKTEPEFLPQRLAGSMNRQRFELNEESVALVQEQFEKYKRADTAETEQSPQSE